MRSHYEGAQGPKDVDGSRGSVGGVMEGDEFSVSLEGTAVVKGKVQDADGKPVPGARVRIERTYGPAIELDTDGSGAFQAEGFVGNEPYEVTILTSPAKLTGKFVAPDGKPLGGVRARVRTDGGGDHFVTSDGDGKWEVEGVLPGEGYHVEVHPDDHVK